MKELEVKILEIDKDLLISKLQELWAILVNDSQIDADFYINSQWQKIRLRKCWVKNILTYKEKIQNDNVLENQEYEVNFDNYSNMENILNSIWFHKYWNSSKHRIEYKLWEITFDLDKLEGIPRLVEIEANTEQLLIRWV